MDESLINFLLYIITLIVGFFTKTGYDKYRGRKQKIDALAAQDLVIQKLFIRLAESNEKFELHVENVKRSLTTRFDEQITKIKEKHALELEKMIITINDFKENCDCPE